MDFELHDKVALVAGASAGLGFAAAKTLFEEGARLAICSSNQERIDKAAISLSKDTNKVLPIMCDLSKESQIKTLIDRTEAHFGKIDILVTNCGGPPLGTHENLTEKEWELAYNLTFMSTIRLIQSVLPGMKERKFGRIILITSMAAKQPVPNLMLSNSYRAGLLGFAKTLSLEIAENGITVNTVLPGYTATDRLDYFAKEINEQTGKSREEIYNSWQQTVPVKRLGKPEELGALITFLASQQAAYITGTAIAADGGRSAGII
ncbi:MAG: SDR family oxidoreductase [candidate division Zixibacteria bacterium]